MADPFLIKTLGVIVASVAAVGLVTLVRLPPAVGYLLAGLVIGPHGLNSLAASPETRFLAELGVIFLMFMVGLEFSFGTLVEARRDVLAAGTLQVCLTTLAVAGGAVLLGVDPPGALLLGGAAAMSSTAITVRQLADQGEISTRHGRLALGILVFQDMATLPFLVAVGAWGSGGGPDLLHIVAQLVIAALAVAIIALICRPVFRIALAAVAQRKSSDLFLLTVLLLALGTASTLNLAGLAAPIGAFLAGMVVGESDFRNEVEDDIRPFRDVLVGLFFVTVGMEVDPSIVLIAPLAVLGWGMAFVAGKALVIILVGAGLRWPPEVAARIAVILAHGGEFGLLLLTLALQVGALAGDIAQPALFALALTMGLGPILIQNNGRIARLVETASHRRQIAGAEAAIESESRALRDHVLLCGCGRVGRLVALVLDAADLPYVAVERDLARFRAAKRQGHKVFFGDVTRKSVMEAAGLGRARAVVVTFDHRHAVERILHRVRHDNPAASTIVSAQDDRELPALVAAGAGIVFPENFAAGLALADQVLLVSGLSQDEAARVVTEVRAELSPELTGRVGL